MNSITMNSKYGLYRERELGLGIYKRTIWLALLGYTYKPNTSNKNNFENKQNTVFIVLEFWERERERERERENDDSIYMIIKKIYK